MVISALLLSGCAGAGPSTASADGDKKTFESAGCLKVSESLVDSIGQGFEYSALTGRAAGFTASQYEDVRFVAVEFLPEGLSDPQIAIFGTNDSDVADVALDGLIIAVDGFATEFSTWGDAPGIGLSIADKGANEAKECLGLPGYTLAKSSSVSGAFDEADFLAEAKSKFGIVDETFDDGSSLTVMELADSICTGDVAVMKENLGSAWNSSFQKFTIEKICPENMP